MNVFCRSAAKAGGAAKTRRGYNARLFLPVDSMTQQALLFDAALLRPALADGTLMLTPNRRLASRIRMALAAGLDAAPAAPIMAIADWLQTLWQQMIFRADPLALGQWVLSPAQESALWEQSVRAGSVPLLRPAQAAEQSASAYRTLALWQQLPLRSNIRDEFLAQPDTATFIEWLDRFERECSGRNAIVVAERDRRVVEAALQNRIDLPQKIIGIGFDDMPPLYRTLLQRSEFSELELPNRLRDAQCVGCDTFEQQLQAAALWVQQQMQNNPHGPFAIVVPNLNQQRAVVERVLLDVLTPDHISPNQSRQLPPLNFSAGEPLAQTPLIRCALQLLELTAPKIELQTLMQLIRAPFLSGADAIDPIVAFIENITDLRVAELSAAQVRQCADAVAQQFPEWPLPAQLQQLGEHVRRERLASARMSASAWADQFSQWLTLLGWPGTRTLDSIEYQQHAQWQQALIDFAQFDQLAGTFDRTQALQRLRQLVQALVFQPQTVDTPIQVLGVLEAAGLQFSGLWICEMGEDCWPPTASAHPLMPRELQRRLRMPRCDADREYAIAQRLTQSMLASAEHVIVSYQREREEVECGPSPLFALVPQIDLTELLGGGCDELLPSEQRWRADNEHHALDTFESGNAPVFVTDERAHGGAGLFKDQAACPFRAFARHRLGARALDEPVAGLDAAERGNILHTALEMVWRELKTHAALIALSETQRVDLCERAAEFALKSFRERNAHRIGHRFLRLEAIRLTRLLQQWLSIESERGNFVVDAIEQRRDLQFAGLQLRLRVDRIDRLDDGRLLVVDYKTKNLNCRVEEWLGERPDEPQLPLYSVLLNGGESKRDSGSGDDNKVAGIAFAQVRNEKPQFVGVGDEVLQAQGFRTAAQLGEEFSADSWASLQAHWKTILENLAHDFIAGKAVVDPKAGSACTYCDLASVCRIAHQFDEANHSGDGDIERNAVEETE